VVHPPAGAPRWRTRAIHRIPTRGQFPSESYDPDPVLTYIFLVRRWRPVAHRSVPWDSGSRCTSQPPSRHTPPRETVPPRKRYEQ